MPFFAPSSSLAAALAGDENEEARSVPRQLTIVLHATSDKERDVRRLRRIHGLLRSYPGADRFTFMVFESGRRFMLEFPNDTTGICSELLRKLLELAGEGNVSVTAIQIQ